jgi:translation initiation factor 2 alpha subunit (eIF-2alpha)
MKRERKDKYWREVRAKYGQVFDAEFLKIPQAERNWVKFARYRRECMNKLAALARQQARMANAHG